MPDFDVLGSSLYGALGSAPSSGFDIVAPNAGGRPMPAQGQNGTAPNGQQPAGQPQGAPVSGLLAGMLGLPTYGGAIPGASYLNPGQAQQGGGQPQLVNSLIAGMAGMNQPGSLTGAAQPQNNAGTAPRSLFDALINGGR